MFKLKKIMFIGYILLGICLIGFGTHYFSIKSKDVEVINNFVASKPKENSNDEDSNVKKHEEHGQVINVETQLSVREEPNTNSSVGNTLYNGMTFDILDKNEEWYKVQQEETVGFVHEDYVEEYAEIPPNELYEASIEQEAIETASTTKSSENEKPEGKPVKAELTAYCNDPRCSDGWGSQTAMQTKTRLGVVAAPNSIPLGSKMYIPELESYKADGMFDVEDRGGAIKVKDDGTYVIDVWVPTYDEALKFGRKTVTVYLIE